MAIIKDSGERTVFATGSVRDMHEGKGDMASLPNNAILRLSKHYELGAKKYGRWNYTKGILVSSFLDSALRHIFKYMDGWDDEDHLSAAAFNILGAMEMEGKHKELIDIPSRKGKNCFDYDGPTGFFERMIAERRCKETACYYNVEYACTCTNDRCDSTLGIECPDYMED